LPSREALEQRADRRLPPAVESAAYFVVTEALTNVAKYASASTAEVTVEQVDGHVVIDVADDGVGGADPGAGTGLAGLADRVAALGGRLVVSSPRGGGTLIRAEMPARAVDAQAGHASSGVRGAGARHALPGHSSQARR
jgi:signal transduction histidine kinase